MDLIDKIKLAVGFVPKPQKWVFIVGCYNSGTTLLNRILATHSQIGSMKKEGQYVTTHLPRPDQVGLPRLWAIDPKQFIWDETSPQKSDKIKADWYKAMSKPFASVLLEKSPTNVAKIKWLNREFNNAHFIGLVRNGYAVAEGISRKKNHDICLSAEQWAVSNKYLSQNLNGVKHILLKYEELVENPIHEFRKITDFIDITPFPEKTFTSEFKVHERKDALGNKNSLSFKNLSKEDLLKINPIIEEQMLFWNYKIFTEI